MLFSSPSSQISGDLVVAYSHAEMQVYCPLSFFWQHILQEFLPVP